MLKLGEKLVSPNKKYELKMQTDGNLVLYCVTKFYYQTSSYPIRYKVRVIRTSIWDTYENTFAKVVSGGLKFQTDANLVIYDQSGTALWSSKTYRTGATKLIMQDDGNLVLYKGGNTVWQTKTENKC